MNKAEVMEKIQPLVQGTLRHVRDPRNTKVLVADNMVTLRTAKGATLLQVAPEGAKAMVSYAGIPLNIAKMLSPGTFGQVLSQVLDQKGSYSLVMKEDAVIDLLPYGAQTYVPPERLLSVIEKAIPVQDFNRVDILPNRVASIEVVGEKHAPVARGDLVRAGVKVNFSPMGTISPSVQSFALVCLCTNGMTSNNVLAEFTRNGGGGGGGRGGAGEGDDIWHFFRDSLRKAYGSFEQLVEGAKKLRAENISPRDRAQMLDALLKQARIGGKIADTVRSMAIENPPRNAWDMQNLITYASSHLLEAAPAQHAQKVAADFADEAKHAQTCPLCRRNR